MNSFTIKSLGSAVVAILGTFAVANPFPTIPVVVYVGLAGLISGWLHLPQPKDKVTK